VCVYLVADFSETCEHCGEAPAVLHLPLPVEGQERLVSLCEACVQQITRDFARDFGVSWGEAPDDSLDGENAGAPFETLMEDCFSGQEPPADWEDPFEDSFFEPDAIQEVAPDNLFQILEAIGDEANMHCEGCGTTWEKIARDERVGCAQCYETFRTSLSQLLEHIQRTPQHEGKNPRAARKRALRAQNLQKRHAHQLQLLQSRLDEAVRLERYEEAAILRDKIKALPNAELGVRSAE